MRMTKMVFDDNNNKRIENGTIRMVIDNNGDNKKWHSMMIPIVMVKEFDEKIFSHLFQYQQWHSMTVLSTKNMAFDISDEHDRVIIQNL